MIDHCVLCADYVCYLNSCLYAFFQDFLGRLADKVDNLNDLQRQADDLGNAGYVSDPEGLRSQVIVGICSGVSLCLCVFTHVYVCVHVCVCLYVCVCACMHAYVCVPVHLLCVHAHVCLSCLTVSLRGLSVCVCVCVNTEFLL